MQNYSNEVNPVRNDISNGVKKQILETILKYIPKETCAIFLFGSLAQNKIYPSSDIDIGIVGNKPFKNSILVKIKEKLEEAKTLRDIDIVDFLSIQNKDFLRIALKEVKIWHQTSRSKVYLNNLKRLMAG
ncbi:MAG: nucleotidyltransferase domain-containing protein [Candidatus Ratteibacteria bacterium]|nr:nucleotidyltransferase domain-containing protein [Candidatus Ratteibacteria bacterium]